MLDHDSASLPYALVTIRFLCGGALALPWALRRPPAAGEGRAALTCAVPLLAGYLLLTVGLQYTTSAVSAFLSYLLVVIVPVITAFTLRRLPSWPVLVGIVLSVAGLRLLTGGASGFGLGEALSLGAALAFAVHVIALGHVAPRMDAVRLTSFQLFAVGAAALPVALAVDGLSLPAAALAGAVGVAIANVAGLVLQTVGQRDVSPSRAALLLMVDPVVAAAGGYLLGERLGFGGLAGAALILAGIAAAETVGASASEASQRS